MSRRLVRAKQKIREAGIPFRVPSREKLPTRLAAVLGVLYLVFNQGYDGSATLRAEALELARLLDRLMPDEPEILGLLALMMLHDARAASRGADGGASLVPLEEQDRSLWDAGLIRSGLAVLDRALPHRRPGPYQVQAAIAACHATARSCESTDWQEIGALYGVLAVMTPSPVVELNRAVAVAMGGSPAVALDMLAELEPALTGYYLLPATRADLLRRLSRNEEAQDAYKEAAELAPREHERNYLLRRLAEVS
jgi:RNA polymerase sigma-70 factor (ECF subfamily)